MEKDITFASVAELSRMLAAREVSAVELAQHYLARIEAGTPCIRGACRR